MALPDKHIYFSGSWRPEQQQALAEAVEDYEARRRSPAGPSLLGKRWVAVSEEVPGQGSRLVAHRFGETHILRAGTVEELAAKIRGLAGSGGGFLLLAVGQVLL